MAEKTVVNPQITDEVEESTEKPGVDAGDTADIIIANPRTPVTEDLSEEN